MAIKLQNPLVVVPAQIATSVTIHSYSVDADSLEVTLGIKGGVEGSKELIDLPPIVVTGQAVIDSMLQAVRQIMQGAAVLWGLPAADTVALDVAIQSQPDLAWKLYYGATRDALYDQVKRRLDEQAKLSGNASDRVGVEVAPAPTNSSASN